MRKVYTEGIEKEEQKSFEFEEYPQLHEYYCNRMKSGKSGKKPTKIILTEIYSPSRLQNKNYIINKSYNNISSKNEEYYSAYKKNIYCDESEFKYNNILPYKTNIKRNINSNSLQTSKDNFLDNYKYYERKNIRDNSNQKFESITKVIGHSNLIPIQNQKMIQSYTTIDLNKNQNQNKNINKNEEHKYISKYNKKIEQHDYRIKKANVVVNQQNQIQNKKKEFKQPTKLDDNKKKEITNKYLINKKSEIKTKIEKDYRKYERKKEEPKKEIKNETKVKYEIKKDIKTKSETKNKIDNQRKQKSENKINKKEIKEPKIINSRENIKKEFSVHSGRYSYKENISNDIINSRKNYNKNSQEKNVKKIETVQKSSKSKEKINPIKKEEKGKKLNTNITKNVTKIISNKININANMSNYKRKPEQKKEVPNNKKNKEITKTESYGKIDMNKYKRKNNDIEKKINIKEKNEIYEMRMNQRNNTPKIKKINFGENYRFYERKYLLVPDENCFTIHHKRSHKIIFDEDNDELDNINSYKYMPYNREERYNNKIISNINAPFEENEDYCYEQGGSYYY